MHRVLNMNSICTDQDQASLYKEEIRLKISEYNTYESQVNDGCNEEGMITLAISADFNSVSEANDFHAWIKQYIIDRRSNFIYVRTRMHDCYHASDQNMPCQIGDIWELS